MSPEPLADLDYAIRLATTGDPLRIRGPNRRPVGRITAEVRREHGLLDHFRSVALAEREGCKPRTADDRLAWGLPSHPIVLLSSLP